MEEKENNTCVELKNLVKRFPGVTAVDHVNLSVKDREVFSFFSVFFVSNVSFFVF